MAMNHWQLAIKTHNTNHPDTDHDCADISQSNPRRYPSTTILLASPECTCHSIARGKNRKNAGQPTLFGGPNPAEERSRATMWDVPRFAEVHRYEAIVVENVVDARNWVMFDAWLMAMHALGYQHRAVYFNAQHTHPVPQSRDRMFVVFWKRGNKAPNLEFRPVAPCPTCGDREAFQSWKNPAKKYGKYRSQYIFRCSGCNTPVEPYFYAAWNAIDWSVPTQRIGDRQKPLSPATMARIQKGLEKYGNMPVVMNSNYGGSFRAITDALATHTTQETVSMYVPIVVDNYGMSQGGRQATKPMGTITAGGINHGLLVANYSPGYVKDTSQVFGTITTTDHHGLVLGESMSSFLQYYYSGSHQTSHIGSSMATVTTTDRAALVNPAPNIEDCHYRMLKPHEVKAAMAFDRDYVVLGNHAEQVKQLGNAVTPPQMEWLVQRVTESLL